MAYAVLAICARRILFALTFMLFLGVLAFDLVWTISVSFGLAPSELVTALDHAQHVHVFQSPLYGALIGVLMVTSAATLWLLYRREPLLWSNIVAMFAAALLFAGVDFVTNVSPHKSVRCSGAMCRSNRRPLLRDGRWPISDVKKDTGIFRHVHVCEMAELWHDVFASVSKLALGPGIGPTEFSLSAITRRRCGRGTRARNSSPGSWRGTGSHRATARWV